MKDDRLEQQFDEYFKSVNTPDNITGDAKKFVKPKNSTLPKFVKFACVAASFVLVLTVSAVAFFSLRSPTEAPPDSSGVDIPPSGDSSADPEFYDDSVLTVNYADAYALQQLNGSLGFITRAAISDNSEVKDCKTYSTDGTLTLVNVKINYIYELTRYESEVYVEFENGKAYEPLKDYYDGTGGTYKGADYIVASTEADNGEPQFRLLINFEGVKYYFDIISSDARAYMKFLEMIVK